MEAPNRQPQLSDKHRHELIHGSGIPAEIVEREGLWSATAEEVKQLLGWDVGSGGIVFPYPGHDDFARVRLDRPWKGPGYTKAAKYLSPKRAGNRLYIPRSLPTEVVLGKEPLIITEGEKKALAAIGKGLACIATAGIWSWKSRNQYGEKQDDERALLADFNRINWQDRELVVLIYDSDITQEHVAWDAYPRLAEQLYRLGVENVKILSLPHVAQGDKTGLDDYLLHRTPDDLRLLIHDTPVWVPSEDGAEAFVSRRIDAACERLRTEGTPDAAYDEDTLLALASAQMAAETEYARARERLAQAGRGVDKRALNRRVKELVDEIRERQAPKRTAPDPGPAEIEQLLPEAPVALRRPPGWHVSERGIYRYAKDEILMASPCPVLITRRLRRVDIGEERLELAYHRDGGWRTIIANPSTVLTARNVVTLSDRGLPVSSETARHLVAYLTDLIKENDDVIPRVEAVGHFGWVGRRAFLPGAARDVVVDIEGASGYEPAGDMGEWLKHASFARRRLPVRFALACAFAAPLLRLVGHRTFLVHYWGDSRWGKTAAGWIMVSVWGNPELLVATFNATRVGLERMAGLYSDLPLLVDERQVQGDRQELIDSLVYMLGLGRSKIRGTKSGGLEAAKTWHTIVMTTGEEPLSSDSSRTGVKTRALEWYCQPFDDEAEARLVYRWTKEHHGHAGPLFIRRLMAELERNPDYIKTDVDAITAQLERSNPGAMGSHLSAVAIVTVADYYASEWVFGEPEDVALEGALGMAQTVLSQLETAAAADEANRALEWIRSWVNQHATKFDPHSDPQERFGWFGHGTYGDAGWVYILPSAFRRCMKEGGFSERRVLRDFAERGWIETSEESGKVNFKIRKRFGFSNARVVALRPVQEEEEEEHVDRPAQ